MAQSSPQYTYSPPPAELPYYNALFSAANKSSTGYLSGPSAVEFLSLSKLPVDLLKQIWTMADQPQSNTLDAKKFFVAVRLIQLFQNGKKPVDLALNLGEADRDVRAPFFEGVDIQQAMQMLAQQQQQQPPPTQQQQQQQPPPPMQQQPPTPQMRPEPQQPQFSPHKSPQPPPHPTMNGAPPPATSTTLTVQDPYTMTPQELSRYEALFPSYAVQDPDGKMFVTGAVAVELFSKSGLDRESLKTIWTMVDDPIDNKLDSIEFSVAMHLIVCITKKGLPIPPGELPGSLKGIVNEARQKQQQAGLPQQQTSQAGMPQQQLQQQPPPSTPGGIPSPDKRPNPRGTAMQQQQPHTMNGEMQGMQQQTGQLSMGQGHQLQQQTQQPPQPHHPPQPQLQQPQMGIGNFGGEPVGGHSVDDAFAGLSNEPVTSIDEYSTIGGGPEGDEGGTGGMSVIGGATGSEMSTMGHETDGTTTTERMGRGMGTISGFGGKGDMGSTGGAQPAHTAAAQEIATPEPSHQPTALSSQAQAAMAPLPMQQQQVQQHQQQQHLLPPKAPRSPRIASPARAHTEKTVPTPEERSAELLHLREAHQKLQAEVISLRAKAASVDEEEQETQIEIGKLAGEIAKLSLELSEAKEALMEKKTKLAETVSTLKAQLEKKESLQEQIADAREMQENLTAATKGVSEVNDVAIARQAKAVAAAAAAKEKEDSTTPPQQLDTADLFSWDAPAPTTPAPASMPVTAPATVPAATPISTTQESNPMGMDFWGSDSHSAQEAAPVPRGSIDDSSVAHSTHSKQDGAPPAQEAAAGVPPGLNMDGHDHFNAYATGSSNPNPYGGFQGMGVMGGDGFGNAMGGAAPAPPQPAPTPSSNQTPSAFPGTAPAATSPVGAPTSRSSFASTATAPAPPPVPAGPPSPTKAELEALKTQTAKKEESFQTSLSLVRSISVEVEQLESQAKKAETEMKAMEGKTKKGTFGGKKKKAKKEYEKAMFAAQQERNKVKEAKAQLVAAEREAERAKKEMEEFRKKYEQMELEAATAASVLSVQQNSSMNTSATSAMTVQPSDSQSVSGMSTAGQSVADQYNDPFVGMMNHAPPPPTSTKSDPYGMGLMGGGDGGDYSNPFTM